MFMRCSKAVRRGLIEGFRALKSVLGFTAPGITVVYVPRP